MTNRLLKTNLIIIFSIISISMAFYLKKNETDEIALNRYNITDEFTPIRLPETAEESKIQNVFKIASEELKINYLKKVTDHTAKRGDNGKYDEGVDVIKVDYYVYTVNPTQLFKRFGRVPDKTNDTELKEFENESNEVEFVIRSIEKDTLKKGTYYLETTNENDLKKYLGTVTELYNTQYGTNLKIASFINTDKEEQISLTTFRYLKNLIIYAVIFLLIILMIWFFCNTHKISIFFLHGSSAMKILRKTFFYEILLVSISLIISIQLFLFKDINSMYLRFQFLITCLFLVVSYIAITMIKSLSLTKQLNKKSYTNNLLPVIYFVKVCLLAISLTLFLPLTELFFRMSEQSIDLTTENYGVFYPAYIGEDLKELQNNRNDSYGINDDVLYNYLEENGALLIDTSNYYQQQTELDRNITVNPNYLEKYPIISAKGKPISIDPLSTEKIVLIPEKFVDSYSEITEFYTNMYKGETDPENITYYLIKDEQKIVTFQNKEPYILTPNIIEVQTKNNSLSGRRVFITGSGETDPIKVKIEDSPEETYESIYEYLKLVGTADNYISLIPIKDVGEVDLKIQIGRINRYLLELFFSVFVVFSLISYITYLYFSNNRNKFALLRLNGVSFWRTYREIFLITAAQYIFLFILVLLDFSPHFLVTVLFFLITELLVLVSTLFSLERQNKLNITRGK